MEDWPKLTNNQRSILQEFYGRPFQRVVYSKIQREELWQKYKSSRDLHPSDLPHLSPAMLREISRSRKSGRNIQSAVFSECAYAQTLANLFDLDRFSDLRDPTEATEVSAAKNFEPDSGLKTRYAYTSGSTSDYLLQAGGFGSVDCVFVSADDQVQYLIEFKERGAKTSEVDLPKYREDGHLLLTDGFAARNPQFLPMLEEQIAKNLNFFDRAGSNLKDFSESSVAKAVLENYTGSKMADVIVTEDVDGFLTMIPANHAGRWARLKGEIRPAGRNHYPIWTPNAFLSIVKSLSGVVSVQGEVSLALEKLVPTKPRGGIGVSRYKIHPLFFVYSKDVRIADDQVRFGLDSVRQLNPTVSAHMFFDDLKVQTVREAYAAEMWHG